MGINGRMEVIIRGVELRRIITYSECLNLREPLRHLKEDHVVIPISEDLSSQITHPD